MKKIMSFLLILLLLLTTGCAKDQSRIEVGTPLSFKGMPVQASGGITCYNTYEHLADIQTHYSLERTVVFRGIKEGLSTPVTVYDKNGTPTDWYCETQLRVLEAFYGDVQVDELVTHKENIRVYSDYLVSDNGIPPLAEGEEYIFILSKEDSPSGKSKPLYGTYSMHYSYHKITDYEAFRAEVQGGTASMRQNFGYEVLDYYLHQPDTRLDLPIEARRTTDQWVGRYDTKEEVFQILTEEQQVLFERMIAQYGLK